MIFGRLLNPKQKIIFGPLSNLVQNMTKRGVNWRKDLPKAWIYVCMSNRCRELPWIAGKTMKPRRKNWVRKKRSKTEQIYLKLNDFKAKGAKETKLVCWRWRHEVCVCGEERTNRESAWGGISFLMKHKEERHVWFRWNKGGLL